VGTPHEDRREQAQRTVGKLAQAGGQAASMVASRAARRADETVRGALPGGIRRGARFTGSRFQRELGTAMATRPHARKASTLLLGTTWKYSPFGHTRAQRKKIRTDGFDTSSRPDLPLDVAELAHIHGIRLPSIMSVAFLHRREDREHLAGGSGDENGSLHQVVASERDRARGAADWTRLCVDTDQGRSLLQVVNDSHLDVLIAAVSQDPAENAADVGLILPQGLPPRVEDALRAPCRSRQSLLNAGESPTGMNDSCLLRSVSISASARGAPTTRAMKPVHDAGACHGHQCGHDTGRHHSDAAMHTPRKRLPRRVKPRDTSGHKAGNRSI